jgi:hypothetical protein
MSCTMARLTLQIPDHVLRLIEQFRDQRGLPTIDAAVIVLIEMGIDMTVDSGTFVPDSNTYRH